MSRGHIQSHDHYVLKNYVQFERPAPRQNLFLLQAAGTYHISAAYSFQVINNRRKTD